MKNTSVFCYSTTLLVVIKQFELQLSACNLYGKPSTPPSPIPPIHHHYFHSPLIPQIYKAPLHAPVYYF